MNLTRLPFNPESRQVREDLQDIHRAHQRMQLLVGPQRAEAKLLWSLDVKNKEFIIQSEEPLKLGNLHSTYLRAQARSETLTAVEAGQSVRIEAWLNPTRVCQSRRSKKLFIENQIERQEWIERKLSHALEIEAYKEMGLVKLQGLRGGKPLFLKAVHVELVAKVKDADEFHRVRMQGVGRGKPYGCGLLRVR